MPFGDENYRTNPYPFLAHLRAEDPVHRDEYGIWLLTRHDDVTSVHADKRFGRDYTRWRQYPLLRPFIAESALEYSVERWFFFRDPPDHTRLRRVAARAFAASPISTLQSSIGAAVDKLVTAMSERHDIEFMSAFARVLPVQMMSKLMGLPDTDHSQLQRWADALTAVFEPSRPLQAKQAADTANDELQSYLRNQIAAHRLRPKDDIIGALLLAEQAGECSNEEVTQILVLLIIAGVETTANLLGNGMFALIQHPSQLARLRANPSLAARAIEELLRYEAPASLNTRVALEDVDIRGRSIAKGDLIFCMLAAANRDPLVFDKPDNLNISRCPNPHVTFGGGGHHCLGAALARLEGQIAMERLLQWWSDIALDNDGARWREFVNLRGLRYLRLRIRRSSNDASPRLPTVGWTSFSHSMKPIGAAQRRVGKGGRRVRERTVRKVAASMHILNTDDSIRPLDSLRLMDFIRRLELACGVHFDTETISHGRFDTVGAIVDTISVGESRGTLHTKSAAAQSE
jgi:pimeloyl-[acyl-carrier protein] synthase